MNSFPSSLSPFLSFSRPFDLGGGHADPVAGLQHIVRGGRLPIHPDQVISRIALWHPLSEKLLNGDAVFDLDSIGESGSIIIDVGDLHGVSVEG